MKTVLWTSVRVIKHPKQGLEFFCCNAIQHNRRICCALFDLTRGRRIEFGTENWGITREKISVNTEKRVFCLHEKNCQIPSQNEPRLNSSSSTHNDVQVSPRKIVFFVLRRNNNSSVVRHSLWAKMNSRRLTVLESRRSSESADAGESRSN